MRDWGLFCGVLGDEDGHRYWVGMVRFKYAMEEDINAGRGDAWEMNGLLPAPLYRSSGRVGGPSSLRISLLSALMWFGIIMRIDR